MALAALLPLICCVLIHGPGFTGMRHYLFTVPPIAVLAGLGFDGALRRLQDLHRVAAAAGLAVVLFCFGWDATILYRLHPDEYLFYNPIVGGLEGASRRYATDYSVNIMPEAVGDLEHFLDRTEPASDTRPLVIIWSACAASGSRSRTRPMPVCNGRAIGPMPISSLRRHT